MPVFLTRSCREFRDKRIVIAAVLAVFLVAFFVIVALAQGIGHPSPSASEVAVVDDAPDGHITVDQFNTALKQTALGQGLTKVPKTSDPNYTSLKDSAMANLLTSRWIEGEQAADRGLTATDTDIQNWIKQNIGGPSQFEKAAKQAGFTPAEARDQARIIVLSQDLQKEVIPTTAPSVSEELVRNFYEANKSQFTQPETRDVREIVNKDQAKVEQAKAMLEKDDSSASWKKVAAKFSTDKATASNGGLRQQVAKGQSEPALDQQIFSAPVGQLVGPFKGQVGYYLIEVQKVTPASVTPLSKLESQIKQQLAQGEQQEIATTAQKTITDKWTSRTFCADASTSSSSARTSHRRRRPPRALHRSRRAAPSIRARPPSSPGRRQRRCPRGRSTRCRSSSRPCSGPAARRRFRPEPRRPPERRRRPEPRRPPEQRRPPAEAPFPAASPRAR